MTPQRPASTSTGFQGTIGSVSLVDLLQVWGVNRISGLVTVTFDGNTGRLYLVEGEVVHAETGGVAGEAAVRVILGWPEGTIDIAPNTTTLERTIHKTLSHLLLDAHHALDEARRARPPPRSTAALPAAAPPDATRTGVLDQIRAIPGVAKVVRFTGDGRPLGEAGPAAEDLAAKGLYLAMMHARAVAGAFGLSELRIAALDSPKGALVVVHSNGSYLCVAVTPGAAVDPVSAQLRALLARPGSR